MASAAGLADVPRFALACRGASVQMSTNVQNGGLAAGNGVARTRAAPLENYFYLFMSLLIAAIVVYGFSRTVESRLIHAMPPRPLLLYVHGAVFLGWVLFFIVQSALVQVRLVGWHRWAGWFGAGLGAAVFVLGVWTAITMARFNKIALHARYPWANLLISFFDITAFAVPLFLALCWRKKPEFHRRLQLMACCALTAAAFGRFLPFWLSPGLPHSLAARTFATWTTLYAGVDLLILVAVARDLAVNRKMHPVYAYGLPAFVVCQTLVICTVVHHSAWWLKTARIFLN